jgi:hypothetical protein
MTVYIVSSNGVGAGKTYLANKLGAIPRSLAAALRGELKEIYPNYDWFNKTQEYKENTLVAECDGLTVRRVLQIYGQSKKTENPNYWTDKVLNDIAADNDFEDRFYSIDDIREAREVTRIKDTIFQVVHFHIECSASIPENVFEQEYSKLKTMADYVIVR